MSLLGSSRDVSRSTFDRWAEFYNQSRIINGFTGRWDDSILKMNLSRPILDLGCATGRLLRKLSKRGFDELFGCDLSRSCLSLAKNLGSGKEIIFAQGYLELLPFKSESFSTVILSGVFHHLERPSAVLKEIASIMKKDSIFILCDPYFHPGLRQAINLALSIYPVFGDRRFYTPSRVESMAGIEGFRKKELIRLPFSYILIFEKC